MKSIHSHSDHLVPIIGIGVTAAVALLYILWSPGPVTSKKSGKRRKVAGLENLGNTCYLNTILQSLAACPAFLAWLNRALRRGCFKGRGNELAYRLSRTLEGVNDYSSSTIYSPHEVLYSLYNRNWRPGQEQQDAHELFQFLLSELSEDREQPPSPLPLSEAPNLVKHISNGKVSRSGLRSSIKANLPRVTNRDVDSPFRGLLAHHLSCTICGHKNPVTYTSFDCLSLPIPTLSLLRTLSLDCILERFTFPELVHGVECTECSKNSTGPKEGRAGVKNSQGDGESGSIPVSSTEGTADKKCRRVFQKQMTISKLPQCLCIHIQRVGWQPDGLPFRREEHIMFPEVLDMNRFRLASVNATCNNRSIGITKSLRLVQPKETISNGHSLPPKKPSTPSWNHNFIGDRFLSPSRPASLRLVGGGWIPTEDDEEGEGDQEEGREEEDEKKEERTCNETTTPDDERDGYLSEAHHSAKPMESKYKLASAVVHVGNAYSGHFLTYRRGPSKQNEPLNAHWLCVSDETVYTAQLADVLLQKAYMLYYQRE